MYRQEEYLYNSTVATAESFVCIFPVAIGKLGSNIIHYSLNQSASNAFQYVVAHRLKYRSAMQGQRYGEFLGWGRIIAKYFL